jgi:hypothetical protein
LAVSPCFGTCCYHDEIYHQEYHRHHRT